MKYTLTNRELGLTAQVEGEIFFNRDGSINYVWSCSSCDIFKDGEFFRDALMSNDNPSYVKRCLRGYSRVD